MPMRAIMEVTDIAGESKLDGYEDQIDIYSVDFGVDQSAAMQVGSGLSVGKAMVGPISVGKQFDAASVYLALASMTGKGLEEVKLTFLKDAGDEHLDYLTITMTNAVVANYSMSGSSDGEIHETVVFGYEEVDFLYKVQGDDQSAGDEHEVGFKVGPGKAK